MPPALVADDRAAAEVRHGPASIVSRSCSARDVLYRTRGPRHSQLFVREKAFANRIGISREMFVRPFEQRLARRPALPRHRPEDRRP